MLFALAAASAVRGEPLRLVEVRPPALPRGVFFVPALRAGDVVDSAALAGEPARLRQAAVDAGYLAAAAALDTSSVNGGLAARLRLEPGPRARVAGWRLRGVEQVDSAAVRRVLPGPGTVFDRRLLDRAAGAVLGLYERRGFALCRVSADRLVVDGDRVTPELAVDEGRPVLVRYVEFAGRQGLGAGLLDRASRFRPGALYTPAAVRQWTRNLERSGLVAVRSAGLVSGAGHGVRFEVAPRASNTALAALGYSTEGRSLSGVAKLSVRNLLNTGRRLDAGWVGTTGRTDWSLSYTEPWVFSRDLALTGSAALTVVDTTWSKVDIGLEATVGGAGDVAVLAGVGFEQVGAADTNRASRMAWLSTGLELDTRDRGSGARRGALLALATRAGERVPRTGPAGLAGRVTGDCSLYGPAAGRLLVESRLHYRLAYARSGVTEQDWFRVGGARSLRGYREQQFGTDHAAWLNFEPQFEVGGPLRVYGLGDVGVLRMDGEWGWRWSYGLGLRAETRIGTADVAYGVPGTGDPLAGMVHLSVAADF